MTKPNPETITAAELAADQLTPPPAAAAPSVSPPAIPAGVPGAAPEVDSLGRPFDAAKFAPKKDTRGRWVNKNAGRKPGSAPAATSTGKSFVAPDPDATPPAAAAAADGPATPATADRFDLAAEMYTRAAYSVADGIFSGQGEWLPESDGEHVGLRQALATYLRHKGSDDLPPGVSLGLAVATYGAKRMSRPKTLSRLRLWGIWLSTKIYAWRTGRRLEALPAVAAPESEQRFLPPQDLPKAA